MRLGLAREDLATLDKQYAEAYAAWKARFDAVEGRERSALRKIHPTHEFWERYEALAKSGEGRAYQWMLEHARDLGLKRSERSEIVQRIYAALLEEHADADWFIEIVSRIVRDSRYLAPDALNRWLDTARQKAGTPMARALATLKYAQALSKSADPAQAARGTKLLAEYQKQYLSPGAMAIDFQAHTVDGGSFKLSDYRGKVVLLDFFGFW